MESNSKKIILSYREGCSGSWLAEFLSCCRYNTEYQVNYRQDINGVPPTVYHFDNQWSINKPYAGQDIITCHSDNFDFLANRWPNFEIYRIIPITFVLDAIAAAWYKIPPKESSTINHALEYIKNYYTLHTQSEARFGTVIDYGKLRNIEWLQDFVESNGIPYNEKYNEFANKYWALQKKTNFEIINPNLTMSEINDIMSLDHDVFGAAMAIFVYEKSNLLQEHQRQWSIDNLTLESSLMNLAYVK